MVSIGYARVSTDGQTTEGQIDRLREAGCAEVYTETASGADRRRPELARVLARLRPGDVLVVVKIDRLARSAAHLLTLIEELEERGVKFKSLGDPIDTTSSSGRFVFQIMASFAELEMSMIRERTVAGMKVAAKNGNHAGNPGLIKGDPDAIAKITSARDAVRDEAVLEHAGDIVPVIEALRPDANWIAVAGVLNRKNIPRPGSSGPWTRDAVVRVSRRLVAAGRADPKILDPAPRILRPDNLLSIVAGLSRIDTDLDEISEHLKAMGQVTERGHTRWTRPAVRNLLDQARTLGLVTG